MSGDGKADKILETGCADKSQDDKLHGGGGGGGGALRRVEEEGGFESGPWNSRCFLDTQGECLRSC